MKVVGKNGTRKADGTVSTTLQVLTEFSDYYKDPEAGRFCEGNLCESIYVGSYDCTKISVGTEIEILYSKAIQTKTGGIYQPVATINIIK